MRTILAFALLLPASLFAAPADSLSRFYSEGEVLDQMGLGQSMNEAEAGRLRAFRAALTTLELYMQLGMEEDAREGARFHSSYRVNERRAFVDTRMHYRENRDLFNRYVSVSSDIYGYEFTSTQLGTVLDIAGGVQTLDGIGAEFEASMVWQDNRWMIWSLEID